MQEDEAFTWGQVEDTKMVHYDTEAQLPYNPFSFDLHLTVLKTHLNLQPVGHQYTLEAGKKVTFGRKSNASQNEVDQFLGAATVSGKHFAIGQDQKVYDLGSTKGTFKWIPKDRPKYLRQGDILLIGRTQFTITSVDLSNCEVRIRNQQTKQHILIKRSTYIIGSHEKCHHIIKNLNWYHVVINPNQAKLISMVEDEDISIERGVWERLGPPRVVSKGTEIQHGDVLMVFPYVFSLHF